MIVLKFVIKWVDLLEKLFGISILNKITLLSNQNHFHFTQQNLDKEIYEFLHIITTKTHESKSNGIFPLSDKIIFRLLQYHHQKTK